jgi:hypothetical protein
MLVLSLLCGSNIVLCLQDFQFETNNYKKDYDTVCWIMY